MSRVVVNSTYANVLFEQAYDRKSCEEYAETKQMLNFGESVCKTTEVIKNTNTVKGKERTYTSEVMLMHVDDYQRLKEILIRSDFHVTLENGDVVRLIDLI